MSTVTYAVADSATLLRRNIKNQLRYPTTALSIVGIPVLFLLLFVYVFGNVLGEGVSPSAAVTTTSTTSCPV
ncbi:hypothetical protein STENM327S_08360 [Streptomyces tendae]